MSAQPAPYVENRADHERSLQWARDRANAGDDTLEICPHCMCEIDVDPQPHRPGCPGIGAPRVSTEPVLAGDVVVIPLAAAPPARPVEPDVDGLDALERMDAGLPQIPLVDEEADVDEPQIDEATPDEAPTAVNDNPFGLQKFGRGYVWTRAAAIAAIRAFVDEHGRSPQPEDAKNAVGRLPSTKSAGQLFDDWNAMVIAAGYTPAAKRSPREPREPRVRSSSRERASALPPARPSREQPVAPPKATEPPPEPRPPIEGSVLALTATQLIAAGAVMDAIAQRLHPLEKSDRQAVWQALQPLVEEALDG